MVDQLTTTAYCPLSSLPTHQTLRLHRSLITREDPQSPTEPPSNHYVDVAKLNAENSSAYANRLQVNMDKEDLRADDSVHIRAMQSDNTLSHPSPQSDSYPTLYTTGSNEDDTSSSCACSEPSTSERTGRVRFRDRVRIASGLNRNRHSYKEWTYYSPTADSEEMTHVSDSASRSSSISVPLRNEMEYDPDNSERCTLGQRMAIIGQQQAERKIFLEQRYQELYAKHVKLGMRFPGGSEYGTERTRLLGADTYSQLYVARNDPSYGREPLDNSNTEYEEYYARQIDSAFGPWPHRLLNHHWWWWQIEPVMYCHCLKEFEDERY